MLSTPTSTAVATQLSMSTPDLMDTTDRGASPTTVNQAIPRRPHAQAADIPDVDPPPYPAMEGVATRDNDDDEQHRDEPVTLVINATHDIKGDCNFVQAMPMLDAARYSAILLASVRQLVHREPMMAHMPRPQINLTINCGVTVVGHRNVIGNMAIRPNCGSVGVATNGVPNASVTSAMAGAKRGAQDEGQEAEMRSKVRRVSAGPNSKDEKSAIQEGQ